jgi:hypothetical protein
MEPDDADLLALGPLGADLDGFVGHGFLFGFREISGGGRCQPAL